MRPRRTATSTKVFHLEGGTEDNDLWVTEYAPENGGPCLGSTWVPTDEERQAIAEGVNIELLVFGTGTPPVAVRLSEYVLGRPSVQEPVA